MRKPSDLGPIHFVGIGGIGMSGIAEVMVNLGYQVQGSDMSESANVLRLREKNVEIHIGHKGENLKDSTVIVVSSAIKADNPEMVEARARSIPVVRRAEMLAELMRFKSCVAVGGTHGKTTTTSLIATLLDSGKLDPTVINGGIINAYGTNARMGTGEWMVVEADESDGTFIKLPAEIAIVTNIDPEHLDHYGSFDALREAFRSFMQNVPFYGFSVACTDSPEVQALMSGITDRRIITYGENRQADVRMVDYEPIMGGSRFDVLLRDRITGQEIAVTDVILPMPGRHNALNAVAAITVATRLGLDAESIRQGLAKFGGVKRRFTYTGQWNDISIYDDYGHHPVEISAVLNAARDSAKGKVIAIVQPHRYSRLKDLFEDFSTCFNDADIVAIMPVYAAGEQALEGYNHETLVDGIRAAGHRDVQFLNAETELVDFVKTKAAPNDIVICLGAGTITHWANSLPEDLGGEKA